MSGCCVALSPLRSATAPLIRAKSTANRQRLRAAGVTQASSRAGAGAGAGSVRREVLDRSKRTKMNTTDDYGFYSQARLCTHVDDDFLNQLTELYRQRIPAGGKVRVARSLKA